MREAEAGRVPIQPDLHDAWHGHSLAIGSLVAWKPGVCVASMFNDDEEGG